MQSINVEVILSDNSDVKKCSITSIVQYYLESVKVRGNTIINQFEKEKHPILASSVKAIIIEEIPGFDDYINFSQYTIKWHVYTLDSNGPANQIEDDDEGEINTATHLMLPSASIYNLWENLYYDNDVKRNLLRYAQTMMEFSDKGVDTNIISCNRVILFHGPPGTGKTSLCKALAQKLTIRMQNRYSSGVLIEINSHSLFSKYFSESGKLVTKMFSKLSEIIENPNLLVCVLIDEVESLTRARNHCLSGTEPSDAIRVVNAVLTQIDKIRTYSNVLILTTSNITESIDLAFIDRADIKQYLGLPGPMAIYSIYYSCLRELIKAQIIKSNELVAPPAKRFKTEDDNKYTKKLLELSEKSQNLSGRSLRKIPFIAHALFLDESFIDLNQFLDAMSTAIDREKRDRTYFENSTK